MSYQSPVESYPRLQEGTIVEYEGRNWLVGYVNQSRARLDPLQGHTVCVPESGRSFMTYGTSVNIAATALVPVIDPATLTAETQQRIDRVKRQNALGRETSVNSQQSASTEVAQMEAAETVNNKVSAAPIPTSAKSRAAKLARKPRNEATPLGTKKTKGAKAAKAKSEKTETRELKPCGCGCGTRVYSYFAPGHDARFKSALLKIERGEETKEKLLKKSVIDKYKWVKTADGERPTTNYKGEPHKGYDRG